MSSEQSSPKPFKLKTLKEFKQFCFSNLLHELQTFEARRKQVFISVIISNVCFLSLIYVLGLFCPIRLFRFIGDNNDLVFCTGDCISISLSTLFPILICFFFILYFYVIIFLIIFIAWALFYNAAFETFSSEFDTKIIAQISQFINADGNLNILSTPSEQQKNYTITALGNSKLFNGFFKPNHVEQKNLTYGDINNIDIMFVKIDVSSEFKHYWTRINYWFHTETELPLIYILLSGIVLFFTLLMVSFRLFKGILYLFNRMIRGKNIDYQRFKVEILKNESSTTPIFKGLFFTAKFNKFAQAVTIIRPNLLKNNINSFCHGKNQEIKLEDGEFAKYFTVYSADQVEARYILSTNLMAKLVKFRTKARRNIYVSFVDDMIYIAIEYPEGVFEPNLFRNMLSFTPLREYFETIQLMLSIVEDLNLDRHIWKSS